MAVILSCCIPVNFRFPLRDLIAQDHASGKFSTAYVRTHYGLDPKDLVGALDAAAFDYEE